MGKCTEASGGTGNPGGTRVQVLNQKRNGSTIIRVRGTRWALGKEIAGGIEVKEYHEQ